MERDVPERDAAGTPQGDRRDGEQAAGADDEQTDGAGGDYGRNEGARFNSVDAADEQPERAGRRSDHAGTDLQLNIGKTELADEAESTVLSAFSVYIGFSQF